MNYPIAYDELLSRDEILKGMSGEFDNIHDYLRELRQENPRDRELRPHKVANHISTVLTVYIRNHQPEYLTPNQSIDQSSNLLKCNGTDSDHVLSKGYDDDIVTCELCDSTFEIHEIKKECET